MYIYKDIQEKVFVKIIIGKKITIKLKEKHQVNALEVIECFYNKTGRYLQDKREVHRTSPPTFWFISQTNLGRKLKVVFVRYSQEEYIIKTSYKPNAMEKRIYCIDGMRRVKK
jgi:hypothetical protein